jgi:hypothetical protein
LVFTLKAAGNVVMQAIGASKRLEWLVNIYSNASEAG